MPGAPCRLPIVLWLATALTLPSATAQEWAPHGLEGQPQRLDPAIELSTPDQEMLLAYLVRCALPEGLSVEVAVKDGTRRLSGDMGLAPDWMTRPLTEAEQRWVSACMLALTNAFGKNVQVSTRAADPAPSSLTSTEEERRRFTLFEGGFHGNIFAEPPSAYVCLGARNSSEADDPVLLDRVCTEPSGERTAAGEPLSRCGFILTGRCRAPGEAGGEPRETIYVYLEPRGTAQDRP